MAVGVVGLFFVVPYLLQVFNPKRHILLVINQDGISVTESNTILWQDITKIHWQNYSTRSGKSTHKHQMLYFYTKKGRVGVNSRYLTMPAVALFQVIKQHYQGPIVREHELGQYQVFTHLGDHWDWQKWPKVY